MGGFVRSITRRILKVIAPPQVQAPVQAPVQATASQIAPKDKANAVAQPQTSANAVAQPQTLAASGYGGSTIMTGSSGVEEEANVSQTLLGGKKKKTIV